MNGRGKKTIRPEPLENARNGATRLVLRLAKRFRGQLFYLFVLLIVNALLKLPAPFLTIRLIDRVLPSKSLPLLLETVGVIVAISALFLLSEYVRSVAAARTSRLVSAALHVELLKQILALPASYSMERDTGYLMARILDDAGQINTLVTDTGLSILQNGLTLAFGIGAVLYINWQLALISLIILPPFAYASVCRAEELSRLNHRGQEARAKVSQGLQETLDGMETVKIYGRERWRLLKNFGALKKSIAAEMDSYVLSSRVGVSLTALGSLGSLVVLCYGSFEIMRGQLSIGGLLAFNSVLGYLYGPSRTLASMSLTVQRALVSVQRVSEILDAPAEQRVFPVGTEVQTAQQVSRVRIRFDDVSFGYAPGREVLQHVSFAADNPAVVAVAGKSGAGKSTLLALILRLYRPTSGRVLLDDLDLTSADPRAIRKLVGFVNQNAFLYNASIMENITLGRDIAESDVVRAARVAYASEFIEDLPAGYGTIIGPRGLKLSNGQRQRIALARALAGNPPILLLDEATAAIDSQSEDLFWRALISQGRERLIFVVSHRLASLQCADQVLLLHEGKLVASGSHRELSEHPLYQDVFAQQLGDFRNSRPTELAVNHRKEAAIPQ
jgi:ABC-type bacteriocin/lantibiotic exporter with double-glycine peptidase domain